MNPHFIREMNKLKENIMVLSAKVEEGVLKSVNSFISNDKKLADEVIKKDREIDLKEVEIEEDCLKILTLYQPVASDLRYIVAVLKINNDLERIGDLAVNIARKAKFFVKKTEISRPEIDLSLLTQKSQTMLKESLDCLLKPDLNRAIKVCRKDEEINKLKKKFKKEIISMLKKDVKNAEIFFRIYGIVRNLERISDIAVNIAEDVIYIQSGKIVRHQTDNGKL